MSAEPGVYSGSAVYLSAAGTWTAGTEERAGAGTEPDVSESVVDNVC